MILDTGLALLIFLSRLCLGESGNYKHYRLESLCKVDSAKVRLRLGDTAATFQLNSSLVPGAVFSCHLELALDSSKMGFFVYFDDLAVGGSADCEDDYVQFGRDILFITSYRSDKFCHRIQGSFPTATNLSSATLQLARGTTPLARRTYLETTDQEMDVWIKLQLSTLAGARSPLSPVKTVSFTVTPVLRTCGRGVAGYRACGGAGASYCLAQQYFCDGRVNCAAKHGVLPPDETNCKTSTSAVSDVDKSDWQDSGLYMFIGPGLGVLVIILFVAVVYHRFPTVLNLPAVTGVTSSSTSSTGGKVQHTSSRVVTSTQYEYHTGHIVPVSRPAPPIPTSATAPPLPRCPPPYSE